MALADGSTDQLEDTSVPGAYRRLKGDGATPEQVTDLHVGNRATLKDDRIRALDLTAAVEEHLDREVGWTAPTDPKARLRAEAEVWTAEPSGHPRDRSPEHAMTVKKTTPEIDRVRRRRAHSSRRKGKSHEGQ